MVKVIQISKVLDPLRTEEEATEVVEYLRRLERELDAERSE